MKKICFSLFVLAFALTIKAMPRVDAVDAHRDSLLNIITGAQLQKKVVSILNFGAKA